jgi:hypothetical protein
MTFKIGKGQYQKNAKNGRLFPVQIINDDGKTIERFEVYGSQKTAKKEASNKISELSKKE